MFTTSVIIVTLDRPDCVRRCLAALAAQTPAAGQTIVVDASKDDRTRDVANTFPGVLYLRNDNGFGRMTASRNIGLRSATGSVIAFVDDDAFVHAGWLAAILDAFAHANVGAAGGRVLNDQPGEATRGVDQIGLVLPDGTHTGNFAADPGRTIEVDHVMGCNMAYRRDVLAQLGGFREDYPGISGVREDTDMCLRVRRLGYRILFNPAAVVDHLGAPQAVGRRFDVRYDYYSIRNHVVMLMRNYGPGSSRTWRYVAWATIGGGVQCARKVGGALARAAAVAAGLAVGLASGTRLLFATGNDPARHDDEGKAIRTHLSDRRQPSPPTAEGSTNAEPVTAA